MNVVNRLLVDITDGHEVSEVVFDNLTAEELKELYISLDFDLMRKKVDVFLVKENRKKFKDYDDFKMTTYLKEDKIRFKYLKTLLKINENLDKYVKINENIEKHIELLKSKQGDAFQR